AVADPGEGGKFVDAFLADERRVHIRNQQALPATRERLSDHIDRLTRERALERSPLGFEVSGENKIGRDTLVEPAPALDAAKGLRGPVEGCFADLLLRGIGVARGDDAV